MISNDKLEDDICIIMPSSNASFLLIFPFCKDSPNDMLIPDVLVGDSGGSNDFFDVTDARLLATGTGRLMNFCLPTNFCDDLVGE
jgi:hypothetical protein